MGFEEHVSDIVGMPGWELFELQVKTVATEFSSYFRLKVNGPKDYENRILLNPEEVLNLMPTYDNYVMAQTEKKEYLAKMLRGQEVMAVYSPDKILEGIWLK